jgi:hypothetical protein
MGKKRRRRSRNRNDNRPKTPITYQTGDMFADTSKIKAMAFGCHPEGELNTELTIRFRNKYPDLYAEYLRRCEANEFQLGQTMQYQTRDGMMVFVLGTQKDKYMTMASGKQIESAFQSLREQMEEHNITSIAMPPIGSGIGALYWHKARRNLERVFKDWQGAIYVYMR